MAKYRESEGRADPAMSGYTRAFGDCDLGRVLSRVQSTVIRFGNELERMVLERVDSIDDLDDFLAGGLPVGGPARVASKRVTKSSEAARLAGRVPEPDFLVFSYAGRSRPCCYVIELKDGDVFDTKKAKGEYEAAQSSSGCN